VQAAMEAHTEPLRASPMPEIPEPASGSDEAGDPASSPPLVEVQAATGTHTEPLGASPTTEIPKPTNASITIAEHSRVQLQLMRQLIDLVWPIRLRGQILRAMP